MLFLKNNSCLIFNLNKKPRLSGFSVRGLLNKNAETTFVALESTFLKGFYQGKIFHAAQIQVKGQEVDLKMMHDELRAVDKNLHDYQAELIHDDIGPRQRKKLLEEFKILTEQRRYLLNEIVQQEALLETSRQNLREVMMQNPY
jgi:small-conductance mechanosensitive channel